MVESPEYKPRQEGERIVKKTIISICAFFVFSIFCSFSNAETQREAYNRGITLLNEGGKLFNSSEFRRAIEKLEAALEIFQILDKKQAVGAVNVSIGVAYINLGAYSKAISYCEKAIAIAEEVGDKHNNGTGNSNLGVIYNYLGDYKKAITYYEKAIAIAKDLGDKLTLGQRLCNLGNSYAYLGQYQKAISYYETAIAVAKEIGDKKGLGTATGTIGSAYNYLGNYQQAITFHEKALAIAEEIGDKLAKGERLGNLGNSYNYLGDYRKAISYYEKALAIAEEIGNKKAQGSHGGNLGLVYGALGDHREAINHFDKALVILEQIGNKDGMISRLGNLGSVYNSLGDYRKAISFYEKSLAIADEIGDKRGKGNRFGDLGNAYRNLGDYQKAIDFFEKAMAIDKEIGIPYDMEEGNLADTYLALDRDDEAFRIYTKQNHPIRLGLYYLKKSNFAKAKEQFDLNRAQYEEARMARIILPQWIGLGISNEGLQEYKEAYKWYTKAITFMEEQRDRLTYMEREHYFEGKEFGISRIGAYEGAVRCAFMLGKHDEAFYWAENTKGRMLSELLSKRHEGASYKIPANIANEEEDLTNKIRINKKQQQAAFEKNNQELLKSLEVEYPALREKMDSVIDRLRKDYPQYASIKYPQPVKLTQLALKKGEVIIEYEVTDPYTIGLVIRDGSVVEAFKVDKTRAELESLVRKFRAPFQEGASMNEFSLNLAKDLTDLLIGPALPVLKKGEHLIIIPDESLSLLPFEALLFSAPATALKEEAILLAQNIKQSDNDTIDKATIIRGLTKTPTTRSIGGAIAPRVSTHILFDTGSAQIRPESQKQIKEIVAALASSELNKAAVQIEGHTDSAGDTKFNMRLSFKRAQAVYDALARSGIQTTRLTYAGKGDTEPVADNKDDKGKRLNRRVDFVRVDSFGTQRASSAASSSAHIKDFIYATDEYPISYYQSASVLTLQRGLNIKRSQDQAFFGLGDPVFDFHDSRSADTRAIKIVGNNKDNISKDIADNEETKDAGYKFSRLVNTAKEVKEVGKLFAKSRMLLGTEATEKRVKDEDLSTRKYVLFSTHGILGNEIPYIKQPALVLSLVGNDQEDGFLTASEIFNLNLNADIVALSACKTGLGVQSAGEGVVGLSRAFMYAGTDTVLVSLWSVADESTYKLMFKFFDGLKNGKDKMTALKEAKNYLRNNGYDNPFYWAPFILMGEAN